MPNRVEDVWGHRNASHDRRCLALLAGTGVHGLPSGAQLMITQPSRDTRRLHLDWPAVPGTRYLESKLPMILIPTLSPHRQKLPAVIVNEGVRDSALSLVSPPHMDDYEILYYPVKSILISPITLCLGPYDGRA